MSKVLAQASPKDINTASIRLLRELYRGSLMATAKVLCGYADITKYTHGKVIEALEANTTRKLIVMPRGSLKSSIGVVAYSIWLLIRDSNTRILIDSERYENSKNFIREIKGILMRPEVTRVFGGFASRAGWGEGEIIISQRTKNVKEASVTASGIGANKVGQHYDVVIMDDLNSNANSTNSEQRAKVIRHYQLNTSILEPNGIMVIVGTRYAVDDVIGHVLTNEIAPTKGLVHER